MDSASFSDWIRIYEELSRMLQGTDILCLRKASHSILDTHIPGRLKINLKIHRSGDNSRSVYYLNLLSHTSDHLGSSLYRFC